MYKDKTKQQANGLFRKSLNGLKADFKLEWKTIKEQFGIDKKRFGKIIKRLFIVDKE